MGELAAVLIELPFILAACWAASQMLIARAPILRTIPAALTMGLLAFALLMATEAWLALWVPGRAIGDWLAQFREAPPLLGLAGQLLAFIPLVQVLSTVRRAAPSGGALMPAISPARERARPLPSTLPAAEPTGPRSPG